MTDRIRRETRLGLSGAEGIEAMEAIIEAARSVGADRSSKDLAAELWPRFKIAVAAAIAENADERAAGGRRWHDARHT